MEIAGCPVPGKDTTTTSTTLPASNYRAICLKLESVAQEAQGVERGVIDRIMELLRCADPDKGTTTTTLTSSNRTAICLKLESLRQEADGLPRTLIEGAIAALRCTDPDKGTTTTNPKS